MNISHISKDMPSFEEHREAVKAELKAITERLEQGVQEVFASERYQSFLDTMAKFPHYSMNNSLLILMQKPDASLVQSYNGWKEMGRYVKKGEKGIRILAPAPYKIKVEQDKTDAWGKKKSAWPSSRSLPLMSHRQKVSPYRHSVRRT